MIELPERPAIRVVTIPAPRAQRALMLVVLFVTSTAFDRCITVSGRQMAFLARRRRVKSDEGEARESMIEFHLRTPRDFVVAFPARLPLLPFVRVVFLVA